jgi:hypothetical protein
VWTLALHNQSAIWWADNGASVVAIMAQLIIIYHQFVFVQTYSGKTNNRTTDEDKGWANHIEFVVEQFIANEC